MSSTKRVCDNLQLTVSLLQQHEAVMPVSVHATRSISCLEDTNNRQLDTIFSKLTLIGELAVFFLPVLAF